MIDEKTTLEPQAVIALQEELTRSGLEPFTEVQGNWLGFEKGDTTGLYELFDPKELHNIQSAIVHGEEIPKDYLSGVKIAVNVKKNGIRPALTAMAPILKDEEALIGNIWIGAEKAATGLPKIILYTKSQSGSSTDLALRISEALKTSLGEQFFYKDSENDPYWAFRVSADSAVYIMQAEQYLKQIAQQTGQFDRYFSASGGLYRGAEEEIRSGYCRNRPEIDQQLRLLAEGGYGVDLSTNPIQALNVTRLMWERENHRRRAHISPETGLRTIDAREDELSGQIDKVLSQWSIDTWSNNWTIAFSTNNRENISELIHHLPALIFAQIDFKHNTKRDNQLVFLKQVEKAESDCLKAKPPLSTEADTIALCAASLTRALYNADPNQYSLFFGSRKAFMTDGFLTDISNAIGFAEDQSLSLTPVEIFQKQAYHRLSIDGKPSPLTIQEEKNFQELVELSMKLANSSTMLTLDDAAQINYLSTRGCFPGILPDTSPQKGDYRFRTGDVTVGEKVMLPPKEIPARMEQWIQDVNIAIQSTPADEMAACTAAAQAHVRLTHQIHPYVDGNGQSARCWSDIIARRIAKTPILLIPGRERRYTEAFDQPTEESQVKHLARLFYMLIHDNILLTSRYAR